MNKDLLIQAIYDGINELDTDDSTFYEFEYVNNTIKKFGINDSDNIRTDIKNLVYDCYMKIKYESNVDDYNEIRKTAVDIINLVEGAGTECKYC